MMDATNGQELDASSEGGLERALHAISDGPVASHGYLASMGLKYKSIGSVELLFQAVARAAIRAHSTPTGGNGDE